MVRSCRRARAQIMPLFIFLVLFMLGIAALLIDSAGLLLSYQDFDALTWRTAHFAAARLAVGCKPTLADVPGLPCTIDTSGPILGDVIGEAGAYAASFTILGSRDRVGMPIRITGGGPTISLAGNQTISVSMSGCYRTFLIAPAVGALGGTFPAPPGCNAGETALSSTAIATVRISN